MPFAVASASLSRYLLSLRYSVSILLVWKPYSMSAAGASVLASTVYSLCLIGLLRRDTPAAWKALTSLEASTLRWAVMGPALV